MDSYSDESYVSEPVETPGDTTVPTPVPSSSADPMSSALPSLPQVESALPAVRVDEQPEPRSRWSRVTAFIKQRANVGKALPATKTQSKGSSAVTTSSDDSDDIILKEDMLFEQAKWGKRRDVPLAVLAWAGVIYLILVVAQHIITSLLLLVIAAIMAFALAPAVTFLQRWLPRFLSILIVYLLILGGLGTLIYLIALTAISQVNSVVTYLSTHDVSHFLDALTPIGITRAQLQTQLQNIQGQLMDQAKSVAGSAVPLLQGFFDAILNIVLVAVLSIYFLTDGEKIVNWLRRNSPRSVRWQTRLTLDTVNSVVGGYIRGQLFLCALIGLLVGVGMSILNVPYALLLGVLAFFLEFIPILGTLVSGAICVLLGLTHGWFIAVIVLLYFIGIHILEGDVIGPRVVGKAIGLHPIVSIAALIAGSELFGVWGALFASPVAGVIQALLIVLWLNWRNHHPHEFQTSTQQALDNTAAKIVEQSRLTDHDDTASIKTGTPA